MTVIAVQPRPTIMQRWIEVTAVGLASVRRKLAEHRDYPKRYAFLENSLMAREMERL
jgi:hypothetical protein